MKLLFLANRTPFPPFRGDKLKIYNLAKRLSKKHELHLLAFAEDKNDHQYEDDLKKIFKEVHLIYLPKYKSVINCLSAAWNDLPVQVLYFRSLEMQQKLDALILENKFDAVHVQHLRMAPYLANNKLIPRILDLPDAFSLYWERRTKMPGNIAKKTFEYLEQKRLLAYEPVMKQFDLSLACSAEDVSYLQERHGVQNLHLLPNGVDLDTFKAQKHDYTHNHTLLFTGNMDYAPNVDAVLYFTKEIFPRILEEFPSTTFVIAGQRPVAKVLALANDHIEITGFVENLTDTYNEASVVVAPLRFGAGTQNKVLEAMAMGVPVVCSNIGFKGLGIENGEGSYMELTAESFAKRVIELLANGELREQTGKKGAAIITKNFSWDKIAQQLEEYFLKIVR